MNSIAPVTVLSIPGNHDWERSLYLATALAMYYNKSKTIAIDSLHSPRKCCIFGEYMFGFTHGKYEKREKLPIIFADEYPEIWGSTKYRIIFSGHVHQHTEIEISGTKVITMPSLSDHGEWENKLGFSNYKRAQARLYHAGTGKELFVQIRK